MNNPFPYGSPQYGKAWRDKHAVRLAAERKQRYHTEWKPRLIRRKYWIDKYKTTKGCQHCGYNSIAVALDFDHINPSDKSFNVSHRICNSTIKKLFQEIRKCQVLCANCHRIETHKEKNLDNA